MSDIDVRSSELEAAAILARVGFTASELRHPVEGLTVEMAATEAAVSATTVDSAISSAADFRQHVLLAAIQSLETTPGSAVWVGLQRTVGSASPEPLLGPIFAARSRELAEDPAFPLFLSGFERLDDPEYSRGVNDVLRRLVLDFWPFICTAFSTTGVELPSEPTEHMSFSCQLLLISDALLRALVPVTDGSDSQARMSAVFANGLQTGLELSLESNDDDPLVPRVETLGDSGSRSLEQVNGLAAQAVTAGVELLLSGSIRPSTHLGVTAAASRASISISSFYRHFGSIVEFERQLLESVGTSLSDGFQDDYFEDVLASVQTSPIGIAQAMKALTGHAETRFRGHVDDGRPGIELMPWVNSPFLGPSIRSSFKSRFELRGTFYERIMEVTETTGAHGLRAEHCAAVTGCVSIVLEFLIRNTEEQQSAERFIAGREVAFFSNLFVPRG